jgi:hypothetical protein
MFVFHNKPVIKSYRAVLIRGRIRIRIYKKYSICSKTFLAFLSFSNEICTVCTVVSKELERIKFGNFFQVLCQVRSDPVWDQGPNLQALSGSGSGKMGRK